MTLDEDYWTNEIGIDTVEAGRDAPPVAAVETIADVVPLDDQFGVEVRKTVPDPLHTAVLGKIEPTAAEIARAGSVAQVPAANTYALLDGALAFGLPDRLAASDLTHRSLFTGAALEDLGETGPWLVQLSPGDDLLRAMFTGGDAPWSLWDHAPGLLIRARSDFDVLWKHLRKFIRVRDDSGKWFYQRFWDPHGLPALVDGTASPFAGGQGGIVRVIAPTPRHTHIMTINPGEQVMAPPVLGQTDRGRHDDLVEQRFARDFADKLAARATGQVQRLAITEDGAIAGMVAGITDQLRPFGFRKRSDIGRLAVLGLFYGTSFLRDPRVEDLAYATLGPLERNASLRALRFEEALKADPRHGHVTTAKGLEVLCADLANPTRLASDPLGQAAFASRDIRDRFLAACEREEDLAALPSDMDSPHRVVHRRIAVLWTPFLLTDPLHTSLRAVFMDRRDDLADRVRAALERRLTKGTADG